MQPTRAVRAGVEMPSRNGNAAAKQAQAPAAPAGQLSPDMAELLSQKIREMEKLSSEESNKKLKGEKDRAKTAAKAKLKEAKKLVADAEIPGEDKVKQLWERLQAENENAKQLDTEAAEQMQTLGANEQERREKQAELNRALSVKHKLESLCRQLQQQSDMLVEERKRLTETERRRRHELADEYQHTIEDVKKKMDLQANERARLARENEELRNSFKKFFERYDGREKELLDEQKRRETDVAGLNKALEEQAAVYKEAATREAVAQRENEELVNAENVLRGQLQTYSSKFSNFQDALSKSDKVLSQYKRQKNKMQRRAELLEKENQDLRARAEKRLTTLTRDRQTLAREKEELQDKCKLLQAERQTLLEESAKEGD